MFHYCERTVVMSLRLQWPDRFIYRCYGPECVCHLIKDKAAEFSNLEWPAHEMLKKKYSIASGAALMTIGQITTLWCSKLI